MRRKRLVEYPVKHPVPVWASDAYNICNGGCIPPEDGWVHDPKGWKWRCSVTP